MDVKNTFLTISVLASCASYVHAEKLDRVNAVGSLLAGSQKNSSTYIRFVGDTMARNITDNTFRSALPTLKMGDMSISPLVNDYYIAHGEDFTTNGVAFSISFYGPVQFGVGIAGVSIVGATTPNGGAFITTPDQGAVAAASMVGSLPITFSTVNVPLFDQDGNYHGTYTIAQNFRI